MKANITFVFWMVLLASWSQCLGAANGFEKETIKSLADREDVHNEGTAQQMNRHIQIKFRNLT